jgi:O-antigen/teichoic acid export membrane protein
MPFLFDRAFPAAPCHSPVTRFALLSALTAVARRMTEEMNVAVIAFFLQPDKIALYNVAGQIGILPCEFLRALNTILGPLAGNLYGKREIAAVRRLHFRTGALLAAAAAAGVAAYLVLGRPLLSLFGAYYRQAFAPMLIVAASTIVTSATGSAEIILNMGGRPHWNTANQVVLVALLAALSWMLVPRYGVTGAAAAYSLSQVARAILAMAEVCWTYRVDARSAAASGRQAEPPSGAASDR